MDEKIDINSSCGAQDVQVYKHGEVLRLLRDLFKYIQAADDSGKTPQEKLDFFLKDHDLN